MKEGAAGGLLCFVNQLQIMIDFLQNFHITGTLAFTFNVKFKKTGNSEKC